MPQVTVYVETALRFLYYLLGCVTDYIVLAFGLYLVRIAIAARPLSLRQCSHAACCEHAPIASWDAVQCIAAGRMLPVACCAHAVRCAQVLTQDDGFTLGRLIAFRGYFGQVCNRPPYFGVREY